MSHSEDRILNMFGRDFAMMPAHEQKMSIEAAHSYWRHTGFPYPQLPRHEVEIEFDRLKRVSSANVIRAGQAVHSTVGLRLANSFHPQMWRVRLHGSSPLDRFEDDQSLRLALRKAAQFWPNRRCWNAQCIRSVFRVLHRSRVANFRPTVARALMERYSRDNDCVLDFSAGYGGRLLAALTLHRKYIGIDPATDQIKGCAQMIKDLAPLAVARASLSQGCAEDILPRWPVNSFNLILSSPPYYDTERYSIEPDQSYLRYPDYVRWRNEFLAAVISESFRVLQKNAYLVINTANVGIYPIADDTVKLGNRIFGHKPTVIRMLLPHLPARRASELGSNFKWEPIFVFKKSL